MSMKKREFRLLMLHERGHNASEPSANTNRAWKEGSRSDRTVRRCFQTLSSEDEEGIGRDCSLDNEQLKAVVEQNPRLSVREMSQTPGVSATISLYQ